MAFGQSAGPPATGRQVKDLLELLNNAGHADFRDARGPMGFNQRQAGGKFTAEEAAELIDQLQEAEHEAAQVQEVTEAPAEKTATPDPPSKPKQEPDEGTEKAPLTEIERAVRTASTKSLVLEVRRRGWIVTKPK